MTHSQVRIHPRRMAFSQPHPLPVRAWLLKICSPVYIPRRPRHRLRFRPPRRHPWPIRSQPIRATYKRNSCRRFSVSTRHPEPRARDSIYSPESVTSNQNFLPAPIWLKNLQRTHAATHRESAAVISVFCAIAFSASVCARFAIRCPAYELERIIETIKGAS
jgi:hypothetical protein